MRLFNIERITLCVVDDADIIVTTKLVKEHIIHALEKSCRIIVVQSAKNSSCLDFLEPYDIYVNFPQLNVEQFFADCPSNVEKMKFALLLSQELVRMKLQGFIFVEVSFIYCLFNCHIDSQTLTAKNNFKMLVAI